MPNAKTIAKRRRLEALYERGRVVRFSENGVDAEETTDDVKIWVGPPSPLHREMAIREAQASRSRTILLARSEDDSSEYVTIKAQITGMGVDELIAYILEIGESERQTKARRLTLLRKEWDDMNSLRDAMRQFEESGASRDDPEWAPLMARDDEFGRQVEEEERALKESEHESLSLFPREELEKRAIERRIEQSGSQAFLRSYEDWMLYYACRDDDNHREMFFEDVKEMKSMPQEVQDALTGTLSSFLADAAEVKNSQAAGSGSASSVQQNEPVTSSPSTQEESIGF